LRLDVTADYISHHGPIDGADGIETPKGVILANAYFDIPLSRDYGTAAGGLGGYLGAGIGGAYRERPAASGEAHDGAALSPAFAAMAGVTYDIGDWVGDLGYRGIYLAQQDDANAAPDAAPSPADGALHELRGT